MSMTGKSERGDGGGAGFGSLMLRLFLGALIVSVAILKLSEDFLQIGRRSPSPSERAAEEREPPLLSENLDEVFVSQACRDAADPAPAGLTSRTLQIALNAAHAEVTATVVFHRCSRELALLVDRMPRALWRWSSAGPEFTRHVIGEISIDGRSFEFAPPKLHGGVPDADHSTLTWQAAADESSAQQDGAPVVVHLIAPQWRAPTSLRVTATPYAGLWLNSPASTDVRTTTLEDGLLVALSPDYQLIQLSAPRTRNADASAKSEETAPRADPVGIRSVLRSLWHGAIAAFPFLVVLLWSRRLRDTSRFGLAGQQQSNQQALMLAIAAALGSVGAQTVHAVGAALSVPVDKLFASRIAQALLVAALWPALCGIWRRERLGRVSMPTAALLLLGAVTLLIAAMMLAETDLQDKLLPALSWLYPDRPVFDARQLAPFVAALLALVVGAWWLGLEAAGWRGALAAAVLVLPAAAGLIASDKISWFWNLPPPIVASVLLVPFGWIAGRFTYSWLRNLVGFEGAASAAAGLLGVLVVTVLAQPPSDVNRASVVWLVTMPAEALVRAWSLLAVATLPLWLYRHKASGEKLPGAHRAAAVALLLIVFNWRGNDSWFGTAARIGVAYALAEYWLFAARRLRWPRLRGGRLLDKAIAELRVLNELRRVRRSANKAMAEKVGKLELTVQEFTTKTLEIDDLIDARAAKGLHARGHAILALNRGSTARPWQRGLRGALMAGIVSLPWVGSYLFSLSQQDLPRMPANAVVQYVAVAFDLLQWPTLGFLFMYFYPYLRGRNGIQKGIVLSAALLLPAVVGNLLSGALRSDELLGFVYWSLQVVICCMTVGVSLGDVTALRLAGKRPHSLIEIYNVGTLTAWFSALSLAVAGALTAAVAGGAGQLVSDAVKHILVSPPPLGQ